MHLQATDGAGNPSAVFNSPFPLATAAPATPTLGLHPASDSPPVGDEITTLATVDLVGITESGSAVALLSVGSTLATTVAGLDGRFRFTGVALAVGDNAISARATDVAGNQSSFAVTINRTSAAPP